MKNQGTERYPDAPRNFLVPLNRTQCVQPLSEYQTAITPSNRTHKKGKNTKMKTRIAVMTGLAGLLLLALTAPAFAEDQDAKGKEVTITGEGKCAKCTLKEGDKCQTVIEAKKDGKTEKYYLTKNDVSENFHEDVCKEAKKVTATGTVKEVDGKKELTASKIELAKD
jgi:RecG-like helicase